MARDGKDYAKTGVGLLAKILGWSTIGIIIIIIAVVMTTVLVLQHKKDEEEQQNASGDYTVNGGTVQNPRSDYAQNEVPKEFKKLYKNYRFI